MSAENLTPAKKMLLDYIDSLALVMGGQTRDVVRTGGLELWPGRLLVAEVVNADYCFINPGCQEANGEVEYPVFTLTVYDDFGDELEQLAINPDTGRVYASFDESDLFREDPAGAPDFMIQSFFARYWLKDHDEEVA